MGAVLFNAFMAGALAVMTAEDVVNRNVSGLTWWCAAFCALNVAMVAL